MRRLILTLTVAGLASGLLASPAAAGGRVRMVDDDGRAASGDCNSRAAAATSIQAAVDASGPGDTVLVCPGIYRQHVSIGPSKDGLTLRSVNFLEAIIQAPRTPTADAVVRVRPGASDVRFERFTVRYKATLPSGTSGRPSCGLRAGILVSGRRAEIRSTDVIATGRGTLVCGLHMGILVTGSAARSVDLRFNTVVDAQDAGIAAVGAGVSMTAFRNIVRYYHDDAAAAPVAAARIRARALTRPSGLLGAGSTGIKAVEGASAQILENTVQASRPGRGPLADEDQRFATGGIIVDGVGSATVARNRVFRAVLNVGVAQALVAGGSSGVTVSDNITTAGVVGILVDGSGALITGNQAHGNLYGLSAEDGSSGNTIADNDARSNYVLDCQDATGATALDVANTWTGNRADSDSPSGICVAQAP